MFKKIHRNGKRRKMNKNKNRLKIFSSITRQKQGFFIVILLIFLFCSCDVSNKEQNGSLSSDETILSDDTINEMFDKSFDYVCMNFYYGTPHWDSDLDYSVIDKDAGNPSKIYHSIQEYKDHMMEDYDLSEKFVDKLLKRYPQSIYEKEGNLYIVTCDYSPRIDVGKEMNRRIIRKGDDKIILRIRYESLDPDSGIVTGSFASDNILIRLDQKWVWDDLPDYK